MDIDLDFGHKIPPPAKRYRIGAIGAGFIMRDVQLVAYGNAGFEVVAIASADPAETRAVAAARNIPAPYDDWHELLEDDAIEVLDIAVPPHAQPEIIQTALRTGKPWKGILAQK